MRKFVSLIAISCLLFTHAKGQQSILFKIKYLPGHIYKTNVSMYSNIEMNIENLTQAEMNRMKDKGISMPLVLITSTLSDLTISADKPNGQNKFPITFSYDNVIKTGTLNGKE